MASWVTPWIFFPNVRAMLGQQEIDEWRNILGAFPQRRNMNAHHVEPVIQVGPKMASLDLGLEILVGRRQHASLYVDRFIGPNRQYFLLLNGPQQFGLRRQGHIADLVQKHGAVARMDKTPQADPGRAPVKAPLRCPKS